MAPPRLIIPCQVLLIVALVVVSARAASPAIDDNKPPFATAADGFLRACCANTTNATVCYDALLPRADSFQGNVVKVASAAGEIAFARLRSFHVELLRLQPRGTGTGRAADMALKSCVLSAKETLDAEGDVLAKVRRLETAAGRRGDRAKLDLLDANLGVGNVGDSATFCTDELASTGDAALASPVGKKVVALVANVNLYSDIAVDLVGSIKL